MTDVALRFLADPLAADCDALVVTAYPEALSPLAQRVDAALGGVLQAMRDSGEISGRFAELTTIPTLDRLGARRVLVVGLGDPDKLDSFRVHNAFHFAGRGLRKRRLTKLAVDVDVLLLTALGDSAAALRAVVTGVLLGNVEAVYSAADEPTAEIDEVGVSGIADDALSSVLQECAVLADATNRTRHWAALPGNRLTPSDLVDRVTALCAGTDVKVEVMRGDALRAAGAGALLGVARGSVEEPAMISLRYQGAAAADAPVLGLVGKGITFDTGGISIKGALGMELMKFDMSGAAAVINAIVAVAELKVPCNVVAVVPTTENMPGGAACKPGDVITAMDGTTIEVINTDAEGRLVLSDGLLQARAMGATHLVDVATLTGAAVIALGHVSTALMSNDPRLVLDIERAASLGGDRTTELPLHPEYDVCLKSSVADIKNWGGKENGTIAGAVFLRRFAHGLPWAHLDIAGTAWNSQGSQTQIPSGASGTPVRTLVHLARIFASR